MGRGSATVLHVGGVVGAFRQRGSAVRMFTYREGRRVWSDDLENWTSINAAPGDPPRRLESAVRGLQSRLRLPYINWFNSLRFAAGVQVAQAGQEVFYERYWMQAFGGLIAARRLGKPLVLEVNGDLFEEYHHLGIQLSRGQWLALRLLNRWLFRGASHIVTVSEPLRQTTIRRWGLEPGKVTAVANGAAVEVFARAAGQARPASRPPTMIFVGSFKPWHGLDLLLEAHEKVVAGGCPARLVLVGDGPMRAELEARAARPPLAGQVEFTGSVPHGDVPALLAGADIAIVNPRATPASRAQSPLKLFEYMAAGKAVIAPALPSLETILTHRKNAYLIPPNDAEALAQACLALAGSPELRAELGRNAQRDALERHSWNSTAARLEAILRAELI
jgi:glycosyltransferase involved in cell wall biosynthesis